MAIQTDTPTWTEVQARLLTRAAHDDAFRQQLLADPKAMIEAEMSAEVTGFKVPDAIEIHVVEETPTSYYLVLPARETDGDLSDEELAGVSGGGSILQGFFQFFVQKEWEKSNKSSSFGSKGYIAPVSNANAPHELS